MTYSIYTIVHRKTGQTYVGITSQPRPRERWSKHLSLARSSPSPSRIALAIRNDGSDQFEFTIVGAASTFDEAAAIERLRITELKATKGGVYNLDSGGSGRRRNDDPVRKSDEDQLTFEEARQLQEQITGLALAIDRQGLVVSAMHRHGLAIDENGDPVVFDEEKFEAWLAARRKQRPLIEGKVG